MEATHEGFKVTEEQQDGWGPQLFSCRGGGLLPAHRAKAGWAVLPAAAPSAVTPGSGTGTSHQQSHGILLTPS